MEVGETDVSKKIYFLLYTSQETVNKLSIFKTHKSLNYMELKCIFI